MKHPIMTTSQLQNNVHDNIVDLQSFIAHCYDPRGEYIWINVYDMTPRGEYMGLNVHVMCTYLCNRIGLVIKGPHVQVWITIYKRSCIHYWGKWIVKYEWYLVIWRGFPYYLRSYCVTYLSWSFATHWHYLHGVYFCYFMIFWAIWFITFGIRAQGLGVSLLHLRHLRIFAITIFLWYFRRNPLEDI